MRPTTLALLARAGLAEGDRCLDLGCGGGHVTLDMARAGARALGVDADPSVIELARADAAAAGLTCEFRAGDCLAVEGQFDLCHARFLPSHVPDPAAVARHMASLLRPGGVVAVEDTDFSGIFCEPPDPAHERYARLYGAAVALGGGDASIGRRLPALLAGAGLADVGVAIHQPAHRDGPGKLLNRVTMERIVPRLVEGGLATAAEAEAVSEGMRAFCAREDTLVAFPRMVQAWGRRPA
jgi:SAM-dependent methyltransferase